MAPVGKDPVQGGKRGGVPYNFGKSGTKGKGKWTRIPTRAW